MGADPCPYITRNKTELAENLDAIEFLDCFQGGLLFNLGESASFKHSVPEMFMGTTPTPKLYQVPPQRQPSGNMTTETNYEAKTTTQDAPLNAGPL